MLLVICLFLATNNCNCIFYSCYGTFGATLESGNLWDSETSCLSARSILLTPRQTPHIKRKHQNLLPLGQFVRQKGPFACIETSCLSARSILLTPRQTAHIKSKQRRGTVGFRPVLVSRAEIAPKRNMCVGFKSAHKNCQK